MKLVVCLFAGYFFAYSTECASVALVLKETWRWPIISRWRQLIFKLLIALEAGYPENLVYYKITVIEHGDDRQYTSSYWQVFPTNILRLRS